MPGTAHTSVKQKGSGHGARNHSHAAVSRLACEYYANYHVRWRPEKVNQKKVKSCVKGKARHLKNRKNRRKS
jgi:hypothetical protein